MEIPAARHIGGRVINVGQGDEFTVQRQNIGMIAMKFQVWVLVLLSVCVFGCRRGRTVELIDPGPQFQKTFETADSIEFVITAKDQYGIERRQMVTVSDWSEVKRFFKTLTFVPFRKGSCTVCDCDGEELVRAFSNSAGLGEFTIHHGQRIRWSPIKTDVVLTPGSAEALEAYLNEHLYGIGIHWVSPDPKAPAPPLTIPTADDHGIGKAGSFPWK